MTPTSPDASSPPSLPPTGAANTTGEERTRTPAVLQASGVGPKGGTTRAPLRATAAQVRVVPPPTSWLQPESAAHFQSLVAPAIGRLVSLEKASAAALRKFEQVDAETAAVRDRGALEVPEGTSMGEGGVAESMGGERGGAGAPTASSSRAAFDAMPLPVLPPALLSQLTPTATDALRVAQHAAQTSEAKARYDSAAATRDSALVALNRTVREVQCTLREFLVAACDACDGVGSSTVLNLEDTWARMLVVENAGARIPRAAPPTRASVIDKWCCGLSYLGVNLGGGRIKPTLHCGLRDKANVAPGLDIGGGQPDPDEQKVTWVPWYHYVDTYPCIDGHLNQWMGNLMHAIGQARKYNRTIRPALEGAHTAAVTKMQSVTSVGAKAASIGAAVATMQAAATGDASGGASTGPGDAKASAPDPTSGGESASGTSTEARVLQLTKEIAKLQQSLRKLAIAKADNKQDFQRVNKERKPPHIPPTATVSHQTNSKHKQHPKAEGKPKAKGKTNAPTGTTSNAKQSKPRPADKPKRA
jgi:hypothetical protein